MSVIDWSIIAAYLVWIIWDGIRLTKKSNELEGYLLASRSLPWWAVGLSVMATQLSAITMIGTTGQGYAEGMQFLQFYFALPIAMIVLSLTLVPFFHNARVFTAYEYLERRFDAKTRTLTSALFLVSRAMATGAVISAPAVFLSVVLGVSVTNLCLLMALPTAVYTMFGGVQAVAWTDVKQMGIIVGGLLAAVVALVAGLPDGVGLGDALEPGRDGRPAPGVRLPLRPDRPLHLLVGDDRRLLPVLLLLRHRPEPGAALSHRQVGGRGPHLAADERLLEDPAAGAGAAGRRAGVRVLRLHAAADAVQLGLRRGGAVQRAGRRLRGRGDEVPGGARRAARGGDRLRPQPAGRRARPRPRPPPSQPPAPTSRPRAPRPSRW